jgi:hypothetical protein
MAKLGNFLQVTDIRGSVGGNVFSHARNGGTLRKRVKPRNPRSTAQLNVRALMTAGARAAQALSSTNKALWVTYANSLTFHNPVTGAAYTPTWMQAYMQTYVVLFLFNAAATTPTTAPTTPYSGDTITLSAAGGSGSITVTGSAASTTGQTVFIYLTKLKSANRAIPAAPGKLTSKIAIPSTPFQIVMSSLAPGTYAVKYRFVKTATGQAGPLNSLGTFLVS